MDTPCEPQAVGSLTPATAHFVETTYRLLDEQFQNTSAEPTIVQALQTIYPALAPADFRCVHIRHASHSPVEESITPYALARLLENAAKRLDHPISSPEEVNALIIILRTMPSP